MVKKTKVKKKLSPEEKLKRRIQQKLYRDFRSFLRELGFFQIKADGVQITVDGRPGELDDILVYENVLLLVEYTIGKTDSSHVLKKKPFFDNILADVPRFIEIARDQYAKLSGHLGDLYTGVHYHVRIIYVPLHEAAQTTVDACPNVVFL